MDDGKDKSLITTCQQYKFLLIFLITLSFPLNIIIHSNTLTDRICVFLERKKRWADRKGITINMEIRDSIKVIGI